MTTFLYRKVEAGREVLLPELRQEVDKFFPDHQQKISQILSNFEMNGWQIVIMPSKPGSGMMAKAGMRTLLS